MQINMIFKYFNKWIQYLLNNFAGKFLNGWVGFVSKISERRWKVTYPHGLTSWAREKCGSLNCHQRKWKSNGVRELWLKKGQWQQQLQCLPHCHSSVQLRWLDTLLPATSVFWSKITIRKHFPFFCTMSLSWKWLVYKAIESENKLRWDFRNNSKTFQRLLLMN